jgi:hypothetical protein
MQALITGILAMLMASKVTQATESVLGLFGGFSSLFRGVGLKVPFFSIFLKDILFIGIQFFAFAAIVFIVSKYLFKSNVTFKALIGVLGVATIPMSVTLLSSIILAFISFKLVLYILLFSIVLTTLLNFIGIREALNISENKAVYSIALSYLVYYFILFTIIAENVKSSVGSYFD